MSFKKKIILGVDPGVADTGFGVIEEKLGKLICHDYGSIKTKAKLDFPQRLKIIYQELNKIIDKYQPQIISIEKLFFCKNIKTAIDVAQARGIVLLTAIQHNLVIKEFTPLQIKQAVTTHGQADKKQIQKMVKLILNLKNIPNQDDAADALAAAICGSN